MSMKMMKKAMIGTAGAVAMFSASATFAQTPANSDPNAWEVLQEFNGSGYTSITSGSYTFSGPTELSAGIGADCNLELTGTVEIDVPNNYVTITVTDGEVNAGQLICNSLDVRNFPWVAYADASSGAPANIPGSQSPSSATADDNVSGNIRGIDVTLFGSTICTGAIDFVFNNGSPVSNVSYFDFDGPIVGTGSCTVDGTLSANTDVNAY